MPGGTRLNKTLVIASANAGKIGEIEAVLVELNWRIFCLHDFPHCPPVEEDGETFLDNALKKARTLAEHSGQLTLADDSGLLVDALGGAPGVRSARYAGEGATDEENIAKLLQALRGVPPVERSARFHCTIVLCRPDGLFASFVGTWYGRIADQPAGENGFGYDPVFWLSEQNRTVAQLPPEIKNRLSHRAQALAALKGHLLSI